MKTIASLKDLEPFGIIPLTGEADSLGFRTLCDLTQGGCELVTDTFGIKPESYYKNWNSGSMESPHVGCVMLPGDAWWSIGVIALLRSTCHIVLSTQNGLFGLEEGEEYHRGEIDFDTMAITRPDEITREGTRMRWPQSAYGNIQRVFTFGSGPRVGTRNVHAMSQRVV